MMDYALNIMGSEWIIIIFVALVVLLGTNRLPDVAKKIGRAVGEYNKTKNQFQNNIKDLSNTNIEINGPVQNERQKLEMIAKSLGINFANKTDVELREIISSKIGQANLDSDKK
ncbi:MAG: twin-arginine translocase TatA/TatE family subunit [Nitrosopumilales archaeon]|nr:twin-arginine translocase TatA/TatE family subunit [Nitrosopumilales archaeon]